eukprot:COSAG05_NODE_305_length_11703_cov_15.056705_10_plen_145_part_00
MAVAVAVWPFLCVVCVYLESPSSLAFPLCLVSPPSLPLSLSPSLPLSLAGTQTPHTVSDARAAMVERGNWLDFSAARDPFGATLIKAGISETTLHAWRLDPQLIVDDKGTMGSLFDQLEDLDAAECVAKCLELDRLNGGGHDEL